jgi:hypothetical protein
LKFNENLSPSRVTTPPIVTPTPAKPATPPTPEA